MLGEAMSTAGEGSDRVSRGEVKERHERHGKNGPDEGGGDHTPGDQTPRETIPMVEPTQSEDWEEDRARSQWPGENPYHGPWRKGSVSKGNTSIYLYLDIFLRIYFQKIIAMTFFSKKAMAMFFF